MSDRYAGLISGTSMDGVDAALVEIGDHGVRLTATHCHPIPADLAGDLRRASTPGRAITLDELGQLDVRVGELFADALARLLEAAGVPARSVAGVGSHGQTLRHAPDVAHPFTLQIGDPNRIASRFGVAVVGDLRRRDMAEGGQGAPLAPGFHALAFGAPGERRVVVNLGGIANITVLHGHEAVAGYDTGPASCLMDGWIRRHRDEPYDEGGRWAASAVPHEGLLARLMEHEYIGRPPPCSTGTEDFPLAWLDAQLEALGATLAPPTVQSTLCQFTAVTVAEAIRRSAPGTGAVFACGGGARNDELLRRIAEALDGPAVATTDALGIAPEWVEAAAFAVFAARTLAGEPAGVPAVTGARRPAILGAVYPAGRRDR